MDWKLELVIVPVSDVDRAKAFYAEKLNFDRGCRPPRQRHIPRGSADTAGLGLLNQHRHRSLGRGAGLRARDAPGRHTTSRPRAPSLSGAMSRSARSSTLGLADGSDGPDPERRDYGSFLSLNDPDGNSWVVQEVKHGKQAAHIA